MKCFQWVEVGKKMEMVTTLPEGYEIEFCTNENNDGTFLVLVGLLVETEHIVVRITPQTYGASLQVECRGVVFNPICETSEDLEKFIYERIFDTVK